MLAIDLLHGGHGIAQAPFRCRLTLGVLVVIEVTTRRVHVLGGDVPSGGGVSGTAGPEPAYGGRRAGRRSACARSHRAGAADGPAGDRLTHPPSRPPHRRRAPTAETGPGALPAAAGGRWPHPGLRRVAHPAPRPGPAGVDRHRPRRRRRPARAGLVCRRAGARPGRGDRRPDHSVELRAGGAPGRWKAG